MDYPKDEGGRMNSKATQSSFTPADTMTLRQRSASCFMKAAISDGLLPTGSADSSASLLPTSGRASASRIASDSAAAIFGEVLGGATTPNQAMDTKPGKVSAMAGTPASEATRFSLHTASALSLPARACGRETPRLSNIRSTSPASSAASAGAVPLYGICVIFSPPATVLNISVVRWDVAPLPCEE